MKYIFILFTMIFCHIIDDYYLQGWLASAKQKSWWEKNAPDELYKNDYRMALFIHSFSWTFMIMIPLVAYLLLSGIGLKEWLISLYLLNIVVHYFVDDLKTNKKKINLIQDQLIHMIQIIATWITFLILK